MSFELAGVLQLVNAALFHHYFADHDRRPPETEPAAEPEPSQRQ
ncbi:hypothetical protein [Actinopolymorpha rutila]|uniref:Uncharacterized protein n=1 Tax=Actinopolymorpha rutila TaxID=446787 RepID=A0A852ZFB6_9ACTN|nr:hypothetical protein [Actinopolymorpha rutila]NYH90845.1 hypothetical protein [Actinopolymorpha rutila]